MGTELERLNTWMELNNHDSRSLSTALGYIRNKLVNVVTGKYSISTGTRWQFGLTFGADAYREVFQDDFDSKGRRWNQMPPEQSAAQMAVYKATQEGLMPHAREFQCAGCNAQARDYHHESYRPEDHLCVVPLCRSCHRKQHWGTLDIRFGVVPTSVGLIRIAIATVPEPRL